MARSFSNAKLFSTLVADNISIAVNRRGYAAAAAAAGGIASAPSKQRASTAASASGLKKQGEEMAGPAMTSPWVPDPVTGYYRPENLASELDVADLRKRVLKNSH